jgi:hypothetical protein
MPHWHHATPNRTPLSLWLLGILLWLMLLAGIWAT